YLAGAVLDRIEVLRGLAARVSSLAERVAELADSRGVAGQRIAANRLAHPVGGACGLGHLGMDHRVRRGPPDIERSRSGHTRSSLGAVARSCHRLADAPGGATRGRRI